MNYVILGIGNKGRRYEKTRHNVGFMVLDQLAQAYGLKFTTERGIGMIARGKIEDQETVLVKPGTYVNLTGKIIPNLMRRYLQDLQKLLVVCDDVNLPFGELRFKKRGSSGGHKGLASIIEYLGTEDFQRLRIGIGKGQEHDLTKHVLGKFLKEEIEILKYLLDYASRAVVVWITEGIEASATKFNKKVIYAKSI